MRRSAAVLDGEGGQVGVADEVATRLERCQHPRAYGARSSSERQFSYPFVTVKETSRLPKTSPLPRLCV